MAPQRFWSSMMMVAVVLAGSSVGGRAWGQEAVEREQLTGCTLPHGEVLLPLATAKEANEGYIFRFSDAQFGVIPKAEPGTSHTPGDVLALLRRQQTGDVLYSRQFGGSLLVISGKYADLGSRFLYELSDLELPAPRDQKAAGDKNTTPGTIEGVKAGHVYLVETTEGKYALLRVVGKQDNGAKVQYVFQPDGKVKFTIPKSALVAATPVAVVPTPAATPAVTAAALPPAVPGFTRGAVASTNHVLVPFLSTYLKQRQGLIERRVEIVNKPAKSEQEIAAKADAIEELGQLQAASAVPVLLREISFLNHRAKMKLFSVEVFHPAVAALQKVGKPASLAALEAISKLPIEDTTAVAPDPLNTTEYRLRLYVLVVRGVEGFDTAEYLLTRDMQKAPSAAHRQLYEEALRYLRRP